MQAEWPYISGKRCAIVPYQQSCCKPFYESKPGIMVLPSDNCTSAFSFIWIPEWDALSQNIFLKTHSSHGNKVFCLLRQIQEAIWTSCFYFFSFPDFTLESNAHTFASNWEIVTGTQSLDSGILSQLMNLTIGFYSISNINLAWRKWSRFIYKPLHLSFKVE